MIEERILGSLSKDLYELAGLWPMIGKPDPIFKERVSWLTRPRWLNNRAHAGSYVPITMRSIYDDGPGCSKPLRLFLMHQSGFSNFENNKAPKKP